MALGSTFSLVLSSANESEGLVPVEAGRQCQILGPWTDRMRLVVLMACDSGHSGELLTGSSA